jgi:hypothetical protein
METADSAAADNQRRRAARRAAADGFGPPSTEPIQPLLAVPHRLPGQADFQRQQQALHSEQLVSSVSLAGPVLAVRIASIDGVDHDPYVVKPFIRIHIVDGRTGRYLRPQVLIAPPPAAIALAGATRVVATSTVEETVATCLPGLCSPAQPPAPPGYVLPMCSTAAINRLLDIDSRALLASQLQAAGSPEADAMASALSESVVAALEGVDDPLQVHLGSGHATPSLLFSETFVSAVTTEEAMQSHAMILFELIDDTPSLPAEALKAGGGFYRIAWGYLRLRNAEGQVLCQGVASPVPLGMPSELIARSHIGTSPRRIQSPDELSTVQVSLFRYRGSANRWQSKLAAGDVSNTPMPDVWAQLLCTAPHLRETIPITLRVAAFSAAIPHVRYLSFAAPRFPFAYVCVSS